MLPQVTENLHVAVGYGLGNSVLIQAPDGIIVVDTTEAVSSARQIWRDFREIESHKPIKAIIYTHQHGDHTLGTKVCGIIPKYIYI